MLEWSPLWFYCSSQNIKSGIVFSSLLLWLSPILSSFTGPFTMARETGSSYNLTLCCQYHIIQIPTRLSSRKKETSIDTPPPLPLPVSLLKARCSLFLGHLHDWQCQYKLVWSWPWSKADRTRANGDFPHALCIREASFLPHSSVQPSTKWRPQDK